MIKERIRQTLVAKADQEYEQELRDKTPSYNAWFRSHEERLEKKYAEIDHTPGNKLTTTVVRYSHLRNYLLSGKDKPDIIIAADDEPIQ